MGVQQRSVYVGIPLVGVSRRAVRLRILPKRVGISLAVQVETPVETDFRENGPPGG
jgi:hypothetical protein